MENIKIDYESYDLKDELKKYLDGKNNVRIFVEIGFGDYLVLIKKSGYSSLYPDLELLSIEYYQSAGISENEWDIKGQEYFLLDNEEEALMTFIRRFTAVSPHKKSDCGFDYKDCISVYHLMKSAQK